MLSFTLTRAQHFLPLDAAPVTHASEYPIGVIEPNRRVHLRNRSLVHDHDTVVAEDRLEPVSDAEQRLPLKGRHYRVLDLQVGFKIDRRCSLVANDNRAASHQGAGKSHHLALAEREVQTFFFDNRI